MINGVPCGPDGRPLTGAQLASLGLTSTGASSGSGNQAASTRGGQANSTREANQRDPSVHKVPGRDRADRNSHY